MFPRRKKKPFLEGRVHEVSGGRIDVWVDGPREEIAPILIVGDKPAWQSPEQISLDGMPATANGYRFYISGIAKDSEISLYAVCGTEIRLCERFNGATPSFERSIFTQLSRALEISKQPDSVAITCWDGGHNPIGRAKVLYDITRRHRPTALFTFLFPEFGGDIWGPLADEDLNFVTIPWQDRFLYLKMFKTMALQFDTIWMCKPRMPTFHLASNLCHENTKLILDLDDNEEHFSKSKASQNKAFGLPSIGISRILTASVPARTAASVTLQKDYNATLVRHARDRSPTVPSYPEKSIKIGFIGTVRPHKRILEAANAIERASQKLANKSYEFHVYGDVQPESLVKELRNKGVTVKQNIPFSQLQHHLKGLDIVLSGMPTDSDSDEPITRYQISAKIGDALSVGRPILVPNTPSVADLSGETGVYLFSSDTFESALSEASQALGSVSIGLPDQFTYSHAYKGFKEAEAKAAVSPRGTHALRFMPQVEQLPAPQPTLLIIWKQHDGGLYGRRSDMVARQYRAAHPGHRVIFLEILYNEFDARYRASNSDMSETAYIREMNARKSVGAAKNADGVIYHQIQPRLSHELHRDMLEYLVSSDILPSNTVIVLFPNILHLERIYDLLSPFPIILDIVDNQLAWASGESGLNVSRQYFSLTRMAAKILFNSKVNMGYFLKNGFLAGVEENVELIPNWYDLPSNFDHTVHPPEETDFFDIFYSGNMNDRVDWELMSAVAKLHSKIRLHLIGESGRSKNQLTELLSQENVVYHGVQNEYSTLMLLSQANLAVMPHVTDHVSSYMNPLKVHMYASLGLHTIASRTPGIKPSKFLTIAGSKEEFMKMVRAHADMALSGSDPVKTGRKRKWGFKRYDQETPTKYSTVIDEVRRDASVIFAPNRRNSL